MCIRDSNYGTGYSGTASRGMGAEAIRKKMESINPDKFKIRKFGVSDVIGLTAASKTSFFYVDKGRPSADRRSADAGAGPDQRGCPRGRDQMCIRDRGNGEFDQQRGDRAGRHVFCHGVVSSFSFLIS